MSSNFARKGIPELSTEEVEKGFELLAQDMVVNEAMDVFEESKAVSEFINLTTERFGEEGKEELKKKMSSKVSPFHLDYYSSIMSAIREFGIEDSPRLQIVKSKIEEANSIAEVMREVNSVQRERLNLYSETYVDTIEGLLPEPLRNRMPGFPLPLGGPVNSIEGGSQVVGIEGNRRTNVRPAGTGPGEKPPEEAYIKGPLLQGDSPHSLEVTFTGPTKKNGFGAVVTWMMYVTEGCFVRRFWIPVFIDFIVLPTEAGKRIRFRVVPDEENTIAWRVQPIGMNVASAAVRRIR